MPGDVALTLQEEAAIAAYEAAAAPRASTLSLG